MTGCFARLMANMQVDSRESVGGSLFVMGNMIDMLMISQLSPISPIINTLSLVCENGMYYYRRGSYNVLIPLLLQLH